ncbi:MAG: hypothetical protein A4C66_04520 [Nitrospira sp. HN-bin3]|nr:MAG: hypothetical protein A4C66_04520 [Nitrospira sp. HN-bin3]
MIEVRGVQGGRWILRGKDPPRTRPRFKAPQDRRGFVAQVDILHVPGLGLGQRHNASFQIRIPPLHPELFGLPQTRQNGQSRPRSIGRSQGRQQCRFFLRAQVARPPLALRFPFPIIEQPPLCLFDSPQRRTQPTEVSIDRPRFPNLPDGVRELSNWWFTGSSCAWSRLWTDFNPFVGQLVTHHLEEENGQILEPREPCRFASRFPPGAKPALRGLILLRGPRGDMTIQYVLDTLPAAMGIDLAASMVTCEIFTRRLRLAPRRVRAAAHFSLAEISAVVVQNPPARVFPGIEPALFLGWSCHGTPPFTSYEVV